MLESPNPTTVGKPEMRFLFYSHDAMGLGHLRRNLALAAAVAGRAPEATILLAAGLDEAHRLGLPPNVEVLRLPGLRKVANGRYDARHLRISCADILAVRSALLTAAVESFRPAVTLVDKHPFGASGELRPALEVLRAAGGRAALGLRDILDDRVTVRSEWARDDLPGRIAQYYDRVLVYGHRTVFDPIEEYNLPGSIVERTRFCGYVVNGSVPRGRAQDPVPGFAITPQTRTRPVVLATAGGGEDGFPLLETFIRAAAGAPWDGILVAGPLAPREATRTLRHRAGEAGVTFHSFVPGLAAWFGLVDAVVSMGGYNVVAEAVSSGTPLVCVPRSAPRVEQLLRARAFAELGLLRVVEPEQLDAARLRRELAAALSVSRRELRARAHAVLNFNGAGRAAAHLLELAERPGTAAAVPVGGRAS